MSLRNPLNHITLNNYNDNNFFFSLSTAWQMAMQKLFVNAQPFFSTRVKRDKKAHVKND